MKILIAIFLALSCLAAAPPVEHEYHKLKSSISVCGKNTCEGVRMTSAVVKRGDKYQYTYVLTNCGGKKTWLVGCSVPDLAMGNTRYYELKPGKSVSITVSHNSPPVEHLGEIKCLSKKKRGSDKEMGIMVESGAFYFLQMGGVANGYIPKECKPKGNK